jgi:hypothetical protein
MRQNTNDKKTFAGNANTATAKCFIQRYTKITSPHGTEWKDDDREVKRKAYFLLDHFMAGSMILCLHVFFGPLYLLPSCHKNLLIFFNNSVSVKML